MPRPTADEGTLAHVRTVLAEAARRGQDPALALDKAGLLTSPGHRRAVTAEAFHQLAAALEEMTVAQLVAKGQRVPATALDTKRAVVDRIRAVVAEGGGK